MTGWLKRLTYRGVQRLVAARDARIQANTTFPVNRGRNYLVEPLFPNDAGSGFFTRYYAEDVENPLTVDFKRFKTEIVRGRRHPGGSWHEFDCPVPSAIPCAVTDIDPVNHRAGGELSLRCPEGDFTFGNLTAERFYYFPVRKPGRVGIFSAHDMIVGEPLPLVQERPHPRKLVLVLFLDNLGWELVRQVPLAECMPSLARFFAEGCIFENYFVNSNWTLPSVSTLVSGLPLAQHRMFHPTRDLVVGTGYPLLPEMFQRAGYLTFQACGNWRKSPRYGYAKGYDRTIYRNQLGMSDILDSYMSHMQAFPKRDTFAWLSIFDLHHPMALVPDVAVQINTPLSGHDYRVDHAKSPLQLARSDGRTARYIAEMKRVDTRLAPLLRWIEDTYDDDEILIAAVADHGTTFVTDETRPLAQERCHAAFMLRGGGVPATRSEEFVQSTDVMPTLLALSGIPLQAPIDGRVPEVLGGPPARTHVYSEIMYPAAAYNACLRDAAWTFLMETATPVDDQGRVDLTGARMQLFRRGNNVDVAVEHPDICAQFMARVKAHVAIPT